MDQANGLMGQLDYSLAKKVDLFDKSKPRYMLRAFLACLFLTLGSAVAFIIASKGDHIAPGLGKMLYAFMFSWSLVMIIYLNAELGTSNMMYLTVGVYRKNIKIRKSAVILFTCIAFNLIGGVAMGFLMSKTAIFTDLPKDDYIFTAITAKLLKTPIQIFVEGIFANIVVNTAVLASMRMKDDAAKVISLIFIIFIFAFLGFEHVIANFPAFSLAYFASGGTLAAMTFSNIATNLVLAFLGNFVGGGLIMGLSYAWLNKTKSIYRD